MLKRLTVAGQDRSPTQSSLSRTLRGSKLPSGRFLRGLLCLNHSPPAAGLFSARSCSIFFRIMESPLAFFQLNSPSQR